MQESAISAAIHELDSEMLLAVSGGCATCHFEMNPPSALDAAAIQGHVNISEANYTEVAHIPHQSFQ